MNCKKCRVMLSDYEMNWFDGLCESCHKTKNDFQNNSKRRISRKPRRFLKN